MYGILKLSETERRTIFRNTARKMDIREAIIEKDYWVCLRETGRDIKKRCREQSG